MTDTRVVLGVFIGGRASRMGSIPKGLIRPSADADTLVGRALGLARELDLEAWFVGQNAPYKAAFPSVRTLSDAHAGAGPLGGLLALCDAAGARPVIALACDMPAVPRSVLARLAAYEGRAAVLAPRGAAGFWEPLCARYRAPEMRTWIAQAFRANQLSLQHLLTRAGAQELEIDAEERAALLDWDAPADVAAGAIMPRVD